MLLDTTCWPCLNAMLDNIEDIGLSLNLLKIFVQHYHSATFLGRQCCMMMAAFEHAFR